MFNNETKLFTGEDFSQIEHAKRRSLIAAVNEVSDSILSAPNLDSVARQLAESNKIQIPVVHADQKHVQRPQSDNLKSLQLMIPYDGNGRFFSYKPEEYSFDTSGPLRAMIQSSFIVLTFSHSNLNAGTESLKADINRAVEVIEQNLASLRIQAARLNDSLEGVALARLEKRRDDLKNQQSFLDELGLPVKD